MCLPHAALLNWPQTGPVCFRVRKVSFPKVTVSSHLPLLLVSPSYSASPWFEPHHWAAKLSTCRPKTSPVSIRSVYPGPIPPTPEATAPSLGENEPGAQPKPSFTSVGGLASAPGIRARNGEPSSAHFPQASPLLPLLTLLLNRISLEN